MSPEHVDGSSCWIKSIETGVKFYAVQLLVFITHLYDLEVKVTDLEILCLSFC